MRALVCLAVAACSSGPSGILDPTDAQFTVGDAVAIANGERMGDAQAVSSNVDTLVADSQRLVVPDRTTLQVKGLYVPTQGTMSGTATCDATGCTFEQFGGSGAMGLSAQTSGTVMLSGATLMLDLIHESDGSLGAMTWNIEGSLTLQNNRLGGNVHSHGDTAGVTWDIVVDFGPAVVDGNECAIGGSIRATTSYADDTGDPGFEPSFAARGDFAFGSPCSLSNAP